MNTKRVIFDGFTRGHLIGIISGILLGVMLERDVDTWWFLLWWVGSVVSNVLVRLL